VAAVWTVVQTIIDGLLTVTLAPCCAACGEPLGDPATSVVCEACWRSIRPLTPPLCDICGDPLASWRRVEPGARCPRCRAGRSPIARSRAVGHYEGALREILHAFKFDGRRSIAAPLAALMRLHGRTVLEGADAVVPVPLHWRRHWRRGFNQSAALARGLELPVVHALRRRRHTRTQADLPAWQRHANVRKAFRVRRGTRLTGACVVLVDDVSTTGATLEACATALVGAGARQVRALTAARVVSRPPDGRPR
jgi:ComF family protein